MSWLSQRVARSSGAWRAHVWIILLLIAVGGFLRGYRLDQESLWGDELTTWRVSTLGGPGEIIDYVASRSTHPPGFYLLMFAATRLFGASEAALRFPSSLAGALCIPAIYILGRRLYGPREGLYAAGLMAVAPTAIYYSQEARANMMLALFSILTTYLWLWLVGIVPASRPRLAAAGAAYLLCSVVLLYLHYYGTLMIALQALGAILFVGRKSAAWLRVVAVYGALAIAFLPWMSASVGQIPSDQSYWLPRPTTAALADFVFFLFGYSRLLFAASITAVIAAGLVAASDLRRRRPRLASGAVSHATAIVVAWLILPFASAFLISRLVVPVLLSRSLIVSLPAASLLVARAITRASRNPAGQIGVWSVIMAAGVYSLVFAGHYYTSAQKQQLREALGYIRALRDQYPSAVIATYAQTEDLTQFDYYLRPEEPSQRVRYQVGRGDQVEAFADALEGDRVEFVWYIETYRAPDPLFQEFLRERFCPIAIQQFIGVKVTLLQVGTSCPGSTSPPTSLRTPAQRLESNA